MSIKAMSADWAMVPTLPILIGDATSRSLSLATAYQATDNSKAAMVMVNLTSIAGLTLGGGTTNTADVLIGATTGVASGTGSIVGRYRNTLTGTLVIGLAINTDSAQCISFLIPIGWYFAIRQTSGTVVINSAFDQSIVP